MRLKQNFWIFRLYAICFCVLSAMVFVGSSQAQELAGQVDVARGTVTATGVDGQTRELSKGSEVFSGDTIETAAKSICALRMIDDAKMILRENSVIVLEEYSYEGTKDDSSVVELVKGGFRGLTGLIGKNNPESYKVKSDVSVLGIRGTEYVIIREE